MNPLYLDPGTRVCVTLEGVVAYDGLGTIAVRTGSTDIITFIRSDVGITVLEPAEGDAPAEVGTIAAVVRGPR